ncbi:MULTISPECIES: enoyl-CoA hydratase-related protein [unclassified Dietzia]|uniref:enoyl-CoA hydratase-related protein n=1 Tax=unclassified Dietzia TaxID=2617939 RepID=UPI000D2105AC|nr:MULTISPECIES: enoyl-CoA hydratase-related protein [unclassified Dietzia]AVZ40306.1 crotonase [Dietzia sp. JS16-p6b]QGW25781.1 enoyl-CoA hydratase [Dietzia sp. DQ12-45-1b]
MAPTITTTTRTAVADPVTVTEVREGIALVELARGKVNALDGHAYRRIAETFDALSDDESYRAVILTGRGRVFCAGNDLNEFRTMDGGNGDAAMRDARRAFFAVMECRLPVIAAVNGPALGSGMGLTASADLVVASDRATFGLPEMQVGVLGGGRFTARMLPEQAMRRMFFTAEAVDAATFRSWGAPIEIVPHAELRDRALERAEVIASRSRYALTLAKQSLNGCEGMDIRSGYELEQSYTVRLSEHPDSTAAVEQRLAAMKGVTT